MRLNYWQSDDGKDKEQGISVKEAKRNLKEKGGFAWTDHYDRDGGLFEVTKIELF